MGENLGMKGSPDIMWERTISLSLSLSLSDTLSEGDVERRGGMRS